MNKRIISMVTILLVLLSVGAFAASNSDLVGKDVVRLGPLGIVSGRLAEKDGKWYLVTKDNEYSLHLGKYEVVYPKGLNLTEGSEAVVRGFVLDSDISTVTLVSDDARYSFRSPAGLPLWSGQGERRNQQALQYDRAGQANYRQPAQMGQNRQAGLHIQSPGMQGRQAGFQSQKQGMRPVQNRGPNYQQTPQGARFRR